MPTIECAVNLSLEECARLGSLGARFEAAMDDDLNTAQALGYLFDAVRLVNRLMEEPSDHPGYLTILWGIYHGLVDLGQVLNLLQADPEEMVKTLRQKAVDLKITPEEIERLIAERVQARKKRIGPGPTPSGNNLSNWISSWKIPPRAQFGG